MTLATYFFGYLSGIGSAIGLLIYFLSETKTAHGCFQTAAPLADAQLSSEAPLNDESKKLLNSALRGLISAQAGTNDVLISEDEERLNLKNLSLYELEQRFQDFCISSKDKGKQLKNISSFLSDIGRAYSTFSKELARLSLSARANVVSVVIEAPDTVNDATENVIHSGENYSDWWKALSLFLDHTADDADRLSVVISDSLVPQVIQVYEDQFEEDKKSMSDGSELLMQLKDLLLSKEPLQQERDKWRLKVSTALVVPAGVPVIGGMTLTQSEEEKHRKVLKLQSVELALLESKVKIQACKSEFKILMPKIISSLQTSSASAFIQGKTKLMTTADSIKKFNDDSNNILLRFKSHISATSPAMAVSPSTGQGNILMGFEPLLQSTLEDLIERKKIKHSSSSGNHHSYPSSSSLLDMTAESAACLAASKPNALPLLPPCFRDAVGLETCVWFNAFSGRVYRDAASSEYFQNWLIEKLTKRLNSGSRPGFIDEFKVEGITFGSTPPLLFNVQWAPHVQSESESDGVEDNEIEKTVEKANNEVDSNALRQDSVHNINETDLTGLLYGDEESLKAGQSETSSVPSVSCKSQPHDDTHIDAESRSDKKENEKYNSGPKSIPGSDPGSVPRSVPESDPRSDEDIECTGDIAFRSGMKFRVSTR